jgi:hypothetical protein
MSDRLTELEGQLQEIEELKAEVLQLIEQGKASLNLVEVPQTKEGKQADSEAKIHCFNTLNMLFNGAFVETKTAKTNQIEFEELQKIVLRTYRSGEITEERAAQILSINVQTFRRLNDFAIKFSVEEMKRMVCIDQIPSDELQKLVFCTYRRRGITEGRAMQILNVDKQEFETLLDGWCIA